jgi:hypothetical protein
MARNQSQDPLTLSPNWHVDCRLTAELPDDRVVSSRFLVNLPFGLVTLGLLVFFGWKLSTDLSLRSNIADWGRRVSDSRIEIANIKQLQRDYAAAAAKIELAHNLINGPLFITHFMTQLSHTRPDQMVIDSIESIDAGIVVRGRLTETPERATVLIGTYMDQLRKDPLIGPHFRDILVTSFDRSAGANQQNFELTFKSVTEGRP